MTGIAGSRPLRVLFLATYFPKPANPLMGPWALEQAQALARAGAAVRVVSLTAWVPRALAVSAGAKAYASCPATHRWGAVEVDYPRWLLYPVKPFKAWAYARPLRQLRLGWWSARGTLRRAVASFRPDVVYCHHSLPNGYLAARLQEGLGLPFVVTDHDFDELEDCARFPERRAAMDVVVARAATLVAVSGRMTAATRRLFPAARTTTIPNGVNLPPPAPPRPERLAGRKVVFSCGMFYERKGFEVLIEAFCRVLASFPDAELRIAGDGPRRPQLEAALARLERGRDRITLLGARPHDEVLREMAWCDVFALVGWDEPFATVYLEAMAAGRPVVCADDGGITDVLEHEVHGLTVPPRDVEAAARALGRLLADDALRARLGGAGRTLIEEQLTWDRVAERYLAVLRAALPAGAR